MAPSHHENPQKSLASPVAEVPAGSRKRREREGAIATPTTTHSPESSHEWYPGSRKSLEKYKSIWLKKLGFGLERES